MHGLAVYVKEGLPFAQDLFLEKKTLQILIYVFDWLYFTQCLNSFSPIDHLQLCAWFFILDEVLSINSSANVFVFESYNVHHKDWLTYSGGTD